MSKRQKNSEQHDVWTKRIVLLTAILNLIKALIDLISKYLN